MEIKEILSRCDHTLLDRCAKWSDIKTILDDAIKYGCASACIPLTYVKEAKEYVGDKLAICTVVGFPNGYSTKGAKVFETREALENGADEIDTVINTCHLKDGKYELIHEGFRNREVHLKHIFVVRILTIVSCLTILNVWKCKRSREVVSFRACF